MSWPEALLQDTLRPELVCLTDLFGIATGAAGKIETRDGIDVLSVMKGTGPARDHITGMYGEPGTPLFKIMIRNEQWKYIFLSNGGREQLFNLRTDPHELHNVAADYPDIVSVMKSQAANACKTPGAADALDAMGLLRDFPFQERPRPRIYQFDRSRGVEGFPAHPAEVLGR